MTVAASFAALLGPRALPRRALAVVAHPDDESFGLGAVLAALVEAGTEVAVVCLTRGEASALGAGDDLATRREAELRAAARALGVVEVSLLDYPDGRLAEVDEATVDALVDERAGGVDLLVAFEPAGVTGHPDHRAATAAASRVAARRGMALLEWGVNPSVAAALRDELGVPFSGLAGEEGEVVDVEVDRDRQWHAIACHGSQATGNPVLTRRLALQGRTERLRYRARVGSQ